MPDYRQSSMPMTWRHPSARSTAINAAIDAAEKASGAARKTALDALAADLTKDVTTAKDSARVKMLIGALKDLSAATK